MDMDGPIVSRESDCEHEFGDQWSTHTIEFMITNLGDRAKVAYAIFPPSRSPQTLPSNMKRGTHWAGTSIGPDNESPSCGKK